MLDVHNPRYYTCLSCRLPPVRGGGGPEHRLQHGVPAGAGPRQHPRRGQHGQVGGHQTRPRQHRDVHTLPPAQLLQMNPPTTNNYAFHVK